jgi:adenylate cyclase
VANSSVESNVQLGQRTESAEPSTADNALDLPLVDRKTELLRWLTEEGRFAPDTGCLLEMLCEKLTVLGTPIARATAHVRTLHPEFRGVSRIWRRGQSTEIRTSRHGIESTSDYHNSPVQHVIETGQWLDTVLSEATDRRFPILATLRAQGITHYVMAPLIFSNRIVTPISWASDAPGGFTEADVELFRDLVPAFAPVLEVTAGRRIYAELLATYVGQDPCARIMAGAVQRGNVHHIKAAMLLADLRGFSRLTDELPEERIIELLNAFFDLVVPGIIGSGGDVLKYIGDAVIAIFPVTRDDPAQACESALAAAQTTLAALQACRPNSSSIFSSISLCTMVMPHTAILALAIASTSPPSGATSTSSAGWNFSVRMSADHCS